MNVSECRIGEAVRHATSLCLGERFGFAEIDGADGRFELVHGRARAVSRDHDPVADHDRVFAGIGLAVEFLHGHAAVNLAHLRVGRPTLFARVGAEGAAERGERAERAHVA